MRKYYGLAMRMRQVEAFRAVMASGGITAAAAMLHVSQPSVTRLIADLEAAVGFALFERRGGRIYPTEQALAFDEAVRRSFAGLELLDQAARRIRAQPVGTLRVAALPALAAAILPAALADFGAAHPAVKVTVEAIGQRAIEDRLFLGQADLGLAVQTATPARIAATPLAAAQYVCALPPGHRLAARDAVDVADLAGARLIGPLHEADALWYGIDRALEAAGIVVERPIEAQHSLAVYAFVEAGLGLAIAEPFSAPLFARLGVTVRRFTPALSVEFVILEPAETTPQPLVTRFREAMLRASAAQLFDVERLLDQPGSASGNHGPDNGEQRSPLRNRPTGASFDRPGSA